MVDFVSDFPSRDAFGQLKIDETDEQGIKRAPSGLQLLCDLGEWSAGRDQTGQGGRLSACALRMPDHTGPIGGHARRAHGRTRTAPVMPAAA